MRFYERFIIEFLTIQHELLLLGKMIFRNGRCKMPPPLQPSIIPSLQPGKLKAEMPLCTQKTLHKL